MQLLREQLHRYFSNSENADRQSSDKVDYKGSVGNMRSTSQVTQFDSITTTGALLYETKLPQNLTERKKIICIYCRGQHRSDECKKFPTVTARTRKDQGTLFYLSQTRPPTEKLYSEEGVPLLQTKKSSPQKSLHQDVSS